MEKKQAVLVVEDDVAIRRLVRMVLERNGFRVDVASDGAEAENRMQSMDYGVIVLDLMMPRLDGFAFLSYLQQHHPERLKRIIVTSAASTSLIHERMPSGTFDILAKPFDISDLAERVRACAAAP